MEPEITIAESDSRAVAATLEAELMMELKDIDPGLDWSEKSPATVTDNGEFVSISFSSEALCLRADKNGKPYYEMLSHEDGGMDMSRAANGLPALMDHQPLKDYFLGRARNIRFEGGVGYADIYLSVRKDAQDRKCDMLSGVAPDISFGYTCLNARGEIVGDNDGIPIVKITNWKPYEISSVAMPVDDGVGVLRSQTRTTTDLDIDALVRAQTVTPQITTPEEPTTQEQTNTDSTVEVGITIKESIVMDEKLYEEIGNLTSSVRALVENQEKKAEAISSVVTGVIDEMKSQKRSMNIGALVDATLNHDTRSVGFELDVQKELRSVYEKAGRNFKHNEFLLDQRIAAASAQVRASNPQAIALNAAGQGDAYAGLTTYGGTVPFLYAASAATQAGVGSRVSGSASYVFMRETAVPTPKFMAENPSSPVAQSTMGFEEVIVQAKTVQDQIFYTRRALASLPENLNAWVNGRMRDSLASKMDADYFGMAQALGTTGLFGLAATAAIPTVASDAGKLTSKVLAKMISTIEGKNVNTAGACFVTTPGVYWNAVNVAKPASIYQSIISDSGKAYGFDVLRSQNIPHTLGVPTDLHGLAFGNFRDSFFIEFSPLVLKVDDSSAPIAGSGGVVVTAYHDYNIAFERPNSFVVVNDLDVDLTW